LREVVAADDSCRAGGHPMRARRAAKNSGPGPA
jgi:hypothetical protein